MAQAPAYASIPNLGFASISVANTARDGTGTLETFFTAGANGSRVDKISIVPKGTTTAGMVRIFISNGTTHAFQSEYPIAAKTPSGTVAVDVIEIIPSLPIALKSGQFLKASTHNAESFNVFGYGADI
jgi:hypothetical protein